MTKTPTIARPGCWYSRGQKQKARAAFSAISTTALTLIGISGATGLIAATMDNSKRDGALKTRIALQSERDALDAAVNASGGLRAQIAVAPPVWRQFSPPADGRCGRSRHNTIRTYRPELYMDGLAPRAGFVRRATS